MKTITGLLFCLLCVNSVWAGDVDIQLVEMRKAGRAWYVSVTLKHEDTGWKHYANAWRIVDKDGKVFGTRKLLHPHVNEQPFTRTLGGIIIPKDTRVVFVEASDLLHGWSKQRVQIDLTKKKGPGYKIK